jgi:predicted HicB family RNase H-like nuclease
MIEYKGYTGVFEYDDTIDALAGHVVDIAGGSTSRGGRSKR